MAKSSAAEISATTNDVISKLNVAGGMGVHRNFSWRGKIF